MDRNGNADVLPPLKSSTKGNVKAWMTVSLCAT